ncbi:MAG TPA: class I SAM-dependent methyltransferase [Gaiellaceae bacterium]
MAAPPEKSVDGGCEARYARHDCLWGTAEDPLARSLADALDPAGALVLDAGCGEGRNAAYLARCGARVRAVDSSQLALEHARRSWPQHDGIEWEQGDLRTVPLAPSSLDGLLACSVLHWLPARDDVAAAIARFRRATRPGGVHALLVFNDRVPWQAPAGESRRPWLLPHDWYLDQYRDWLVLDQSDIDETGSHAGHVEPHTHAVTRIVARRPAEGSPR